MKMKISDKVEIPRGIECELSGNILKCKKGTAELSREIHIPGVKTKVDGGSIVFNCEKGNKKENKSIKTQIAHIKNMYRGLDEKYVYKMQACNVHFPMTLKVEGDKLTIANFLGEKIKRYAKIVHGVDVQIKGQDVIVSSNELEKGGQTAANIERATKILRKDRRVFQDGIFIVEKGWGLK